MSADSEPLPQPTVQDFLASLKVPVAGLSPTPALPAVAYSHEAMIQLMVEHPQWTHKQLAAHFGRTEGWFASVLASDSFQLLLNPRRAEVLDPSLTATMEERLRALALQSMNVLQRKLDGKEVSDLLVLKATEISIKGLGMGMKGNSDEPSPLAGTTSSQNIADKLLAALEERDRRMTINGSATVVPDTDG